MTINPSRLRLRLVLPGLLAVLTALSTASAAGPSTVTLRDGSTITGEVVSLEAGLYTIRSATLGTLTLRQADVQSIADAAAPPPAPALSAPAQLDAVQERIAADPALMQDITALQDVPEIQALLEDPEVMNAIRDGNLEALVGNPKLARLAADPRVQAIVRKLSP